MSTLHKNGLTDEYKAEVKTHAEFVKAYGINCTSVQVDDRPDMDSWGQGATHYVFVLRSDLLKGHITGYYSMGSAHTKPPKSSEILCSLALDSTAAEESFEDWCANFGSDPDSIKSRETWKACRKANADLVRFLGQEAFDHLMACEEE